MRKILERCPSCGSDLEIAELRCTRCETQVRARYRPCDFCRLTEEQSTFMRLFVASRGNLTELEKRLGVSYPTVRAKLDEVIERLGPVDGIGMAPPEAPQPPPAPPPPLPRDRRALLEMVQRGELTPAEAARQIQTPGADA
jgi:hypothetical protein